MLRIGKLATAAALLALIGAGNAAADGAIAMGSTGDVSTDGVAYGYVGNRSSTEAVRVALQTCRAYDAPEAAAQCMVVASFRDECVAVANDPQPGTPGTAWAVHPNRAVAEQRALDGCRATAGAGRRNACRLDRTICDGAAEGNAAQP